MRRAEALLGRGRAARAASLAGVAAVAWVGLAASARADAAVPAAPPVGDAANRSEFWAVREQAYREDPRGPFTAVGSFYLAFGETIALHLDVDGDSLVADESDAEAGLTVGYAEDGFTLTPSGAIASPATSPVATIAGKPLAEPLAVGSEPDEFLDVRVGRFLVSLDVQDGRTGRVVAYDPDLLAKFHGFRTFPEDVTCRVTGRCGPANADTLQLGTTRGRTKALVRAATLTFDLAGRACSLSGFRFPGDTNGPLFVPFRDATSGEETYGVGRYLEVNPAPDGTAVLDFNRATNPWCAYSPWYNCVLPPEENTLPVPVRAGERAPAGH